MPQRTTPLLTLIAALICLGWPALAEGDIRIGDVPLPAGAVTPPDGAGLFAGTWVGKWDGRRNHILIVSPEAEGARADVIYAVGGDLNGAGRWFRRGAKIEGRVLTFDDGGFPAQYEVSETGRLRGVFAENKAFSVLERRALSALLAEPSKDWFELGTSGYLTTDLVEDGRPVRLNTVIYPPQGDGPFPLALIHHGSTGNGRTPSDFAYTWQNAWLADILNARGWIVAFPQRRGRGGSDGLYDEGFAEDRSKGYSPEAERALAGADRALVDANAALEALRERDDVDADAKVLLGGVSRGGVVAIMQAGDRPDEIAGVLNFVGGWVAEGWADKAIQHELFGRIGAFRGPVLSIYGEDDPFYSVEHSKENLEKLDARGVRSELLVVQVPGARNGHWALWLPNLWEERLERFMKAKGLGQ